VKGTQRLALSALFVSIMLVLGYLESLFSLGPIPGIKLGLSNSVLLLCLYWLGVPTSVLLMLAKVFLSGFLFGSLNTIQYSLAGGVVSMLGMIAMTHGLRGVSPVGAGVVGGALHNVGQVLMAMLTLQTASLLYYMAVLVFVGAVMGGITGSVVVSLKRFLPYDRRQRFGFVQNVNAQAKGEGTPGTTPPGSHPGDLPPFPEEESIESKTP